MKRYRKVGQSPNTSPSKTPRLARTPVTPQPPEDTPVTPQPLEDEDGGSLQAVVEELDD